MSQLVVDDTEGVDSSGFTAHDVGAEAEREKSGSCGFTVFFWREIAFGTDQADS